MSCCWSSETKNLNDIMPASTNLFKVLAAAEDPSQSLEDEIGCMTGIFQMFDRSQSFTGSSRRRYGSKRVISAAAGKITPNSCSPVKLRRSYSICHHHPTSPIFFFPQIHSFPNLSFAKHVFYILMMQLESFK